MTFFINDKYYNNYFAEWGEEIKEFDYIKLDSGDIFDVVDYKYNKDKNQNVETFWVTLEIECELVNDDVEDKNDFENIKCYDIGFVVCLTKTSIQSRFLGNYNRWRVSDFFYAKGEIYTIKDLLNDIAEEDT